MKFTVYIPLLLLLNFPSFGQVNTKKPFQKVLTSKQIGKEFSFSKNKGEHYDSLVLVYLGTVKTNRGRTLRVLTSRWYWGSSPRATSRIIIFNGKDQYLGDYYLTMTYDVPDRIEGTSLVFVNDSSEVCDPKLVTRINLRNGIPRQFFLKCKGTSGDIYSFGQNL